jgi:hypothetical protein
MEASDGPHYYPIETGVVRFRKIRGAAWGPGMIGITCLVIMIASALYGQWKSLYGIPFWVAWHAICVLMYRRDPQWWELAWENEWHHPWPTYLAPAPGVSAPAVVLQASVPVRAVTGTHGE